MSYNKSARTLYDPSCFAEPLQFSDDFVACFDELFDSKFGDFFSHENIMDAHNNIVIGDKNPYTKGIMTKDEFIRQLTSYTYGYSLDTTSNEWVEGNRKTQLNIPSSVLFDLDMTIGEMAFIYVRYVGTLKSDAFNVQKHVHHRIEILSYWMDSMRAVAPKHETLGWLVMSQALGLSTTDKAEEAITRFVSDGWHYDDILPFLSRGITTLDIIRHALNNDIDITLLLSTEKTSVA